MRSSQQSRWKRQWVSLVAPWLLAGLVTLALAAAQSMSTEGGLSDLERQALGWMLIHRPSRPADPRLVLVAVDSDLYEQTEALETRPSTPRGRKPLEAYRKPECECPGIPRVCYAMAVERLHRWGAKAVVLDIMFGRKGYSPTDRAEDARLGDALFQANNVVAAAVMRPLALDRSRDPTRTSDAVLDPPTAVVADNAQVGSPKIDPRDQEYCVELQQTVYGSDGKMHDFYSMPYLAFCQATGRSPQEMRAWKGRWLDGTVPRLLGDIFTRRTAGERPQNGAPAAGPGPELIVSGDVTLDEAFYQKRLVINYSAGARAEEGRFLPVRLSWLLTCSDAEGRARFGNRTVLIGDPATDLHRTLVGAMPGTEVLANAVATFLENRPIVPAPAWLVLITAAIAAVVAAGAVRSLAASAALGIVALEVLLLAAGAFVLIQHDSWFMPVTPVAAVLATSSLAFFAQSRVGQSLVGRLIPARISRSLARVGGLSVEEGTVMFSDIRGYSTLSEYMDPAEMMSRLNAYFTSVHEILDRYGGHFIKSPGDCVVAWFAEERHGEHHADRAIRAAIELVMNAVRIRQQWSVDGGSPFDIGVGINTGPMAVGILDACRHIEPTIIGDTVNLASRIESLTKEYGAPIIVSEDTLNPVRERFLFQPLGQASVKGRSQVVQIYGIVGIAETAGREKPPPWWRRGARRAPGDAILFRVPLHGAARAPESSVPVERGPGGGLRDAERDVAVTGAGKP